MTDHVYSVLFLCTGNSARSILAACILNREGQGRFKAFSAGSQPKGEVHPFALELLRKMNYPTAGLRSKSWEFAAAGAPPTSLAALLHNRISVFTSLPIRSIDWLSLQNRLDEIGRPLPKTA